MSYRRIIRDSYTTKDLGEIDMETVENKRTGILVTIKGDKVQNVGYRPFLLEKAVRLKIKNFDAVNVESEKDDEKQTLIIYVSGEDKQISEFVEFTKSEKGRPKKAKVDSVIPGLEYLEDVISIEEYRNILSAEQQSKTVQGGLLIGEKIDLLRTETTEIGEKIDLLRMETTENFEKIDLLRTETAENFEKMDTKYKFISEGMFTLANKIDKRMEKLEERNEIVDARMEKTEKNIEKLLEILIQQKK